MGKIRAALGILGLVRPPPAHEESVQEWATRHLGNGEISLAVYYTHSLIDILTLAFAFQERRPLSASWTRSSRACTLATPAACQCKHPCRRCSRSSSWDSHEESSKVPSCVPCSSSWRRKTERSEENPQRMPTSTACFLPPAPWAHSGMACKLPFWRSNGNLDRASAYRISCMACEGRKINAGKPLSALNTAHRLVVLSPSRTFFPNTSCVAD